MKNGAMQVGFSQRIQLTWLEYTAGLVRSGKTRGDINDALQELLEDKLSVGHQVQRGNREKAITILMKIWHMPPNTLMPLRDEGLELLGRLPSEQRIAIHWGMTMAVYPFFGTVAATVGRLLRLQHDVATSQVQRRIREQLGERDTVARAARRIYRSFIDWGVLEETATRGTYANAKPITMDDPAVCAWLIEAFLHVTSDGWTPVQAMVNHPVAFPFTLPTATESLLLARKGLELMRHSVDETLVRVVRRNRSNT